MGLPKNIENDCSNILIDLSEKMKDEDIKLQSLCIPDQQVIWLLCGICNVPIERSNCRDDF